MAVECFKKGLYCQGILHDCDKFMLDVIVPYSNYFFGPGRNPEEIRGKTKYYDPVYMTEFGFDKAIFKHFHRSFHHWQSYVICNNDGSPVAFEIPEKYLIEMLCDWVGAGRAQKNGIDTKDWYMMNKDKMVLHPTTRKRLEELLKIF